MAVAAVHMIMPTVIDTTAKYFRNEYCFPCNIFVRIKLANSEP